MKYSDFVSRYLGTKVQESPLITNGDPNRSYTAIALIQLYLKEAQDVMLDSHVSSIVNLCTNPPAPISSLYAFSDDIETSQGDIVMFKTGSEDYHIGIATGTLLASHIEILEQNGQSGNCLGDGGDAIRTNCIEKLRFIGSFKPIKPAAKETTNPEYKAPPGALHVPRAVQRVLIKVDLTTYGTPGLAIKREKPTDYTLRQGMQEFDELKLGMLRLKDTHYWINPADNIIKPVVRPEQLAYKPDLDGEKEAKENYKDFIDQNGNLVERYFAIKEKGAFVIDFKTGKTVTKGAGHVWLAGHTVVDDRMYGISTKCLEMDPVRFIGIAMNDLYEDETFSKEVSHADKKALRTLGMKDYYYEAKAKVAKKIMDITKG